MHCNHDDNKIIASLSAEEKAHGVNFIRNLARCHLKDLSAVDYNPLIDGVYKTVCKHEKVVYRTEFDNLPLLEQTLSEWFDSCKRDHHARGTDYILTTGYITTVLYNERGVKRKETVFTLRIEILVMNYEHSDDDDSNHGWYSLYQAAHHGASIYINKMGKKVEVTEITSRLDPIKQKHTCIEYVGELKELVYSRFCHGKTFYVDDFFVDNGTEDMIRRLRENCPQCKATVITPPIIVIREDNNTLTEEERLEMALID
jgi:hypothetical protein